MTALTVFPLSGWYEITSEGQVTLYFSAVDEGIITSPTDTPANKAFRPRVLNPDTFSIRRAPGHWVWGSTGTQGAAFGQLILDNYDGAYNDLLEKDFRDSVVTIKLVPVTMALLTGTTMADAMTVCTGIIDKVTSDREEEITIAIKDTIARLDKQLPCKFNPPFVDAGAANTMVPLTFGACRNIAPLLMDTPNRIYQLHDQYIPNVTLIADKAAPLDPYATPPQYVPALSGSGFQLATLPVGKLTVDCSSYGTQSVIPGASDVLAYSGGSYGDFTASWSGSPAVPLGWTWTNNAGSSITEVLNMLGSGKNGALISSSTVWYPPNGYYGDVLSFASILLGGYSYRLNFSVAGIVNAPSLDGTMKGGVMVSHALSSDPKDWITGYGSPIQATYTGKTQTVQNISIEFTVPPGSTRDLNFHIVPSTGNLPSLANGSASAYLFNITLELLGQYQSLPLSGIPFHDYCDEILVQRAGEESTVYNSTEAAALTLERDKWGIHFDSPPNILDALRQPLDTFGATMFTDHLGKLRFRKLTDPTNPSGSVIANFDTTNMARPIHVSEDEAKGLTNLFGARRNWSVFGPSDFVTDQAIVPQNIKTQFSRTSQYEITSSASPAGQYNFAIGAPIFNTLWDDPADCQVMADEFVGIYSPKVYSDGSFTNGKRRFVTFTAYFDDPAAVGVTTTCAVTDLIFGEIIKFTYPNADGSDWFVDQLAEIVAWEVLPFSKKIQLTVLV